MLNINDVLGTVLGLGRKHCTRFVTGKISILMDLIQREEVHSAMNKRKKNKKLESCMFYDLNDARKHVRQCWEGYN